MPFLASKAQILAGKSRRNGMAPLALIFLSQKPGTEDRIIQHNFILSVDGCRRHNVVFSNAYWSFVCRRVGHNVESGDGPVPYKRLLAPFKSGGRTTDKLGLAPVRAATTKVKEAKQMACAWDHACLATDCLCRLPLEPAKQRHSSIFPRFWCKLGYICSTVSGVQLASF